MANEYEFYPPDPRRLPMPEGERFRRQRRAAYLLEHCGEYSTARRAEIKRELLRQGLDALPAVKDAVREGTADTLAFTKSVLNLLVADEIGLQIAKGLDAHEDSYPVETGAAWIAKLKDHTLSPSRITEALAHLSHKASTKISEALSVTPAEALKMGRSLDVLYRLGEFWREEDFKGNTEDYQDPRNSWLSDVLERKTGLPITLSIVFMSICRHLGLDAQGVGLPFHFVVRVEVATHDTEGFLFVDPFHGARPLDLEDCRKLVESSGQSFDPQEHLQGSTSREILVRMCNNLVNLFDNRENPIEAERAATVLMHLCPRNPVPRMVRAERRLRRGETPLACEDLNAVIQMDRDGPAGVAAKTLLKKVLFGHPV